MGHGTISLRISAPNYAAGWQGKVSLGTTEVNVKFESSQSGFEAASAAVQQASKLRVPSHAKRGSGKRRSSHMLAIRWNAQERNSKSQGLTS